MDRQNKPQQFKWDKREKRGKLCYKVCNYCVNIKRITHDIGIVFEGGLRIVLNIHCKF